MLGVVGSSLTIFNLEPTTPNMSQRGGQTYATCCARQCCDMLCWLVAIVWPGLYAVSCSIWSFRLVSYAKTGVGIRSASISKVCFDIMFSKSFAFFHLHEDDKYLSQAIVNLVFLLRIRVDGSRKHK